MTTVTSITATASHAGGVRVGDTVTFVVYLSAAELVTGYPTLTLSDGATASYVSGSGTNALTFSYTVGAGQNAASLAVTGLALNGGTIAAAGSFGFAAPVTKATTSSPVTITTADLNGDGIKDTVVLNGDGTVSVLLANGSGGFSSTTSYAVGSFAPSGALNYPSVIVADVNGDGKADLIVPNGANGSVSVLLGNGSGGFSAAITDYLTAPTNGIAVGDLNGDGKGDLVSIGLGSYGAGSGTVYVSVGNGSGGFGTATAYNYSSSAGQPTQVLLADLNGDGKLDALLAGANGGVTFLPGTGTGGFNTAAATTLSIFGSPPTFIALGDLNGDGKLDLVAAGVGVGETAIAVALGDGAGGFGAVTEFAVSGDALSIALADVNGDGKLDIITADDVSGNISVFLGTGSGSFGPENTYAVGNNPYSITATDLNGDGKLDIVVSDPYTGKISVLTNTSGAGGTLDASTIATVTGANSGIVVDTSAPAVTVALASDTGASATDNITSNTALTGTGDANATVTLHIDGGSALTTTANAAGVWNYAPIGLVDGPHSVTVSETDAAGNTGTATLSFTRDTAAPAVTIVLASDTGVSGTDKITSNDGLSGTGDPNATVTLTIDGGSAQTTTATGTGGWNFSPTGLADGSHTVVVSETDVAGNTGTASLAFTLDTVAPVVTVALNSDTGVSGSDHITLDDAVNGTGAANATVSLSFDGGSAVTTTANGAGIWTYTPTGLALGAHTVVVSESDTAGNTGTASLAFTLQSANPIVTAITATPSRAGALNAGQTISFAITLSAAVTVTGSPTLTLNDGASASYVSGSGGSVLTFNYTVGAGQNTNDLQVSGLALNGGTLAVPATLGFAAQTTYAAGSGPTLMRAADFNGDGKLDLAVSDVGGANIDVLLGNGAGGFSAPTSYAVGSSPYGVATADLNGDGQPDLISANNNGSSISVLLNNGSGGFGAATTYAVGAHPEAVSAVDLNGDGKVDLVVSTSSGMSVLLNNGSGGFGTVTNYSGGSGPWGQAFADVNSDGKIDLIVVDNNSNSVAVLLGNGTGGFGTPTSYAVGAGPIDVYAADLNGDGKLDLVVGNGGANTVSVLLNNGHGGFNAQTTYAVGGNGRGVTVADVNGDGIPDIISVSENSNNLSVLLGNGSGGFGTAVTYSLASGPRSVVAADVNGDGRVDLLVADSSGVVSVLLNTGTGFAPVVTASAATATGATTGIAVDTTAPMVTLALASDTGSSATDGITANDALTGTGDPNATVTLTIDGGSAVTTTATGTGTWTYTPTGLADGSHTVIASEVDAANNTGTASLGFTLDTVAPTVTVALAADTGSSASDLYTANQILTGTADANASVSLTIDGGSAVTTTADGTGAWSYTGPTLADGNHSVVVSESDVAGNTGTASLSFTLDTTPPAVTAALTTDSGISASDGITNVSAISGGGDANALVSISEAGTLLGTTTADGAGLWSFNGPLSDGAHTLTVSETDLAGNVGSATVSFSLDTIPPDSGPNLIQNPNFNGAAGGDASGSFASGLTVPGWSGVQAGVSTASGTYWDNGSVPGQGSTGSVGFAQETGGIDGTLTQSLSGLTVGATYGLSFYYNASAYGAGVSQFNITMDDGSGTVLTTVDTGVFAVSASSPGDYSIPFAQYSATFVAVASAEVLTFTTAPLVDDTPTLFADVSLTTGLQASLAVDSGLAGDGITNNDTLQGVAAAGSVILVQNGATTVGSTIVATDGSWSVAPTGLADGVYSLTVTSEDVAGNVAGSVAVGFTLDTFATVSIALSNDTGSSSSDGITRDATIGGMTEANAQIVISETGAASQTVTADGTGHWTYNPTLADGAHTLTATETDIAGNTASASVSFLLDTVASATIGLVNDTGSSNSDGVTNIATVGGTTDANAQIVISEIGAPSHTVTADGTGHWTYNPTLADGAHTLTATETDIAGNTASASVSFVLDTVAIATIGLLHDTGSSGSDGITNLSTVTGTTEANAQIVISEAGVALHTVTADGAGNWSYAPTLADGAHSLTATETDLAGNTASASVSFTLDTYAAVTIGLASDTGLSASDGITKIATVTGTTEANATVVISEVGAASHSVTADGTGQWSYNPTLADGAHTLTATETDIAGNTATNSVSFTLDTLAPVAPGLTGITPDTGISATDQVTNTGTIAVLGTGEVGATITLASGTIAIGTAVVASNGTWSVTPTTPLAQGTYSLTATATDKAGNQSVASAAMAVTILAAGATTTVVATTTNTTTTATGGGQQLVSHATGQTLVGNAAGGDIFYAGADTKITAAGSGNTVFVAPGNHPAIALGANNNTVTMGDGNNTVTATGTGNTITGGNGNMLISGLTGSSTITLGDGNNTLTISGGNNHITVGTGVDKITISGSVGNNVITAGNGANVITLGGPGNLVNAGNGANTITVTGALANITAGNGANKVTVTAASATITTGSGNDTISATVGSATIKAGLGLNTISFGGSGTVVTNQGGTDTITDNGTNNHIVLASAGNGLDTINGAVLTNGDVFDLRAALAATSWDHTVGTVGNYLSLGVVSGNTTVAITPTGVGGISSTVAVLNGKGAVSLTTFLTHALIN